MNENAKNILILGGWCIECGELLDEKDINIHCSLPFCGECIDKELEEMAKELGVNND